MSRTYLCCTGIDPGAGALRVLGTPLMEAFAPFIVNRDMLDAQLIRPVASIWFHYLARGALADICTERWGNSSRFYTVKFCAENNHLFLNMEGDAPVNLFGALSAKAGINLYVYWVTESARGNYFWAATFHPHVRRMKMERALNGDALITSWGVKTGVALLANLDNAGRFWDPDFSNIYRRRWNTRWNRTHRWTANATWIGGDL